MATIVTRAGNGSPLTNNQVDANFTNLNNELATAVQQADFNAGSLLYATADDTPQPISIVDLRTLLGDGVPVGTIIDSAASSAPTNYLLCNGAAVSRTTYAALFAAIGTNFGQGDGSTTFNLPDGRGKLKRGVDHGAGNDPDASSRTAQSTGGNTGDAVGSVQADAFKEHNHFAFKSTGGGSGSGVNSTSYARNYHNISTYGDGNFMYEILGTSDEADVAKTSDTGGSETRPINFAVNFYIKY